MAVTSDKHIGLATALRATTKLAHEAVVEQGLCGSVSPNEMTMCIRYENHPGACGWDRQEDHRD